MLINNVKMSYDADTMLCNYNLELTMIDICISKNDIELPGLFCNLTINYEKTLKHEGIEIDLNEFNRLTNLNITDINVLLLIATHSVKLPPVYWSELIAVGSDYEYSDIENMVIGLKEPVESLDFPGYYIIPYYSNYVIAKDGRLIKKSENRQVKASLAQTGYYTFRMGSDTNKISNQLRHRILAMAFLKYDYDFSIKDINHIDGIPGSDAVSNLEWCTRSENMDHAYDNNLRNDNIEVEVRDIVNDRYYYFRSCAQAAEILGCSDSTISNRIKSNGFKSYNGFQYRRLEGNRTWPDIELEKGNYSVILPDGEVINCGRGVAARYCNVTETSLNRLIREGRNKGNNENIVMKIR